MNEKQKEYSVLEIKKYNIEIDKLENKVSKNQWFLLGSVVLAATGFAMTKDFDGVNSLITYISSTAGWAGIASIFYNLKSMVSIVSKKAGLENSISRIKYEMGLADLEDEKDKGGPRR